jgi:hypothetical protein
MLKSGFISVTTDIFRKEQELWESTEQKSFTILLQQQLDNHNTFGSWSSRLAVANGYFMGCINRVGTEKPWNLGKFYGTSYFVNPLGEIFATASEDNDELLIAEFDLDLIDQVRSKWQFYRDRRPETYDDLTQL